MRQAAGLHAAPRPRHAALARRALAVAIAAAFGGTGLPAWSQLPTGPQIVNGSAGINTSEGQMTVSNTANTVIDWTSFSIGPNNGVHFDQSGINPKVLNRVIGNDPSGIFGSLTSNGSVWLINPNGVLFGAGARVDVGGLVASTLALSNEDFLAGRYRFEGAGLPGGAVVNRAGIRTSFGGHVWLVGASVLNGEGIDSEGGSVVLAAGSSVELVDSGIPNVTVRVTATTEGVENLGAIVADGGAVDLHGGIVNQNGFVRAHSLGSDADTRVHLSGKGDVTLASGSSTSVDAGTLSVASENGQVLVAGSAAAAGILGAGGVVTLRGAGILVADDAVVNASGATDGGTVTIDAGNGPISVNGLLLVAGDRQGGTLTLEGGSIDLGAEARLDVTGALEGGGTLNLASSIESDSTLLVRGRLDASGGEGVGGTLNLSGPRVAVYGQAEVLASGAAGGGRVSVESNAPAASAAVYIGPDALIAANATDTGSGGSIVIGSNGAARIHGSAAAPGGPFGGNGGSIRTYGRFLDARAANVNVGDTASAGVWTIEAGTLDIGVGSDTPLPDGPEFSLPPVTEASSLPAVLLARALAGGTTVVVRSGFDGGAIPAPAGNIVVSENLFPDGASMGAALTLHARNDIVVNENVNIDGAGMPIAMKLIADSDALDGGGIRLLSGSRLASAGGDILLGGGNDGASPASEIAIQGASLDAGSGRIATVAANTVFENASLYSYAPGDAIVMRTTTFSNTGSTLITDDSRWLMYLNGGAELFSPDAFSSLDYNFVEVGANPATSPLLSGNGVLITSSLGANITLDAARPYDGTTNASFTRALTSDLPAGFVLSRGDRELPGQGSFDNRNAGIGKQIFPGEEMPFFDVLTTHGVPVFSVDQFYFGDITPKAVSYTMLVADKVYDATRAANVVSASLAGLVEGDAVSLEGLSGLFDDKNVGAGKTVTTSATLGGADASNYVLAGPVTTTATITPRELAIGIGGEVRRQYDAGSAAAIDPAQYLLDGLLAGDLVAVTGPTLGSYDTPNVGQGKAVTVSGPFTITGADAPNYSVDGFLLSNAASNTVTSIASSSVGIVTPAILIYHADQAVRDMDLPITGLTGTVSGFLGNDSLASATSGSLSWTSPATSNSAPGNYAINGAGLVAANYMFVQAPGNAQALVLRAPALLPPPEPVPPPLVAAPQQAQQSSAAAIAASVKEALPPSNVRGGGVLDISSPAAGKTFAAVKIASMSQQELAYMLAQRRDFKRKLFADAIYKLEIDPSLADLRPCTTVVEASTGSCRITKVQLDAVHAVQARAALATSAKPQSSRVASLPKIERKIALLFGINNYQDKTIPRLENAVPDVDAVARLFADKLGYEVRVLHNPTKADIIRALNGLSTEIGNSDSVVVYYAGHGYSLEKNGAGYWLPADAKASDPSQWVSNSDVAKLLSGIRARQMALVSDSCYSGAFARDGMDAVGRNVDADEVLSKRSVVVISSGGDEPVADEGKENHSIFAWNLMKAINGVANWRPGSSVFEEVQAAVKKEFPQTPHYGAMTAAGHQNGGDYLFELRTN